MPAGELLDPGGGFLHGGAGDDAEQDAQPRDGGFRRRVVFVSIERRARGAPGLADDDRHALLVPGGIRRKGRDGRDFRGVENTQRHVLPLERRGDTLQGREVLLRERHVALPDAYLPEAASGEVLHLLHVGIGVGAFGFREDAHIEADARVEPEYFRELVVHETDDPLLGVSGDSELLGRLDLGDGLDTLRLGESRRQRVCVEHDPRDMVFARQLAGDVAVRAFEC